MSTFEVLVRRIDDIYDHPNADRLSIVKILGYEAISNKLEDDTHRYAPGDLIVYVPEAAVLPEDVLKQFGFWREDKGIGMLAGKQGDRVKAIRLRGIFSQGLIFPLRPGSFMGQSLLFLDRENHPEKGKVSLAVREGDNVADFLNIIKYEPPIPMGMSGEVAAATEFSFDYDIENAQNFPGFLDNDEVEATEKLHGTCFRVAYHPTARHADIFEGGSVSVSSKGLGAKGLVFKDNEANNGVVYVRIARALDLPARVRALGERLGARVDLFGEIFGAGVQDLHYGTREPSFRAFDIAIDRRFVGSDEKAALFAELGVERVPVLYRGPWDTEVLVGHRDGMTTLGGDNIREGIVVTAVGDQASRLADGRKQLRPILKMVSPDYLTRKGGTEYN